MKDIINRVDLQKLIDNFNVDEYGGFAFVVGSDGVIFRYKKRNLIGTNVTEYDWGKKLLGSNSGRFYYEYDGDAKFLSFRKVGDNILVTTVFVDPYITPLKNMDRSMLLTSIIMAIILSVVITILLRKFASIPLNILNKKILILAEGDLTQEIKIKSNDEVGDLARGVNNFVASLRKIVGNIKKVSSETQHIKDNLKQKSKESSHAVNKILITI